MLNLLTSQRYWTRMLKVLAIRPLTTAFHYHLLALILASRIVR